MKELTIVEKDRVGLLADVSGALGGKKVNIDSLSVEVTPQKTAILRILTNAYIKAKRVLNKAGFKVMDTDVLVVRLPNKPGALAAMSRALADEGINIENIHLLNNEKTAGIFAIKINKYGLAREVLRKYL
ncbi:MAG: ACT domain-containing protein [Candidatus Micrarchaeota archaeon]|nr:ACT domain-containing protein [Candidatus Micrarchaeota archaeon]